MERFGLGRGVGQQSPPLLHGREVLAGRHRFVAVSAAAGQAGDSGEEGADGFGRGEVGGDELRSGVRHDQVPEGVDGIVPDGSVE